MHALRRILVIFVFASGHVFADQRSDVVELLKVMKELHDQYLPERTFKNPILIKLNNKNKMLQTASEYYDAWIAVGDGRFATAEFAFSDLCKAGGRGACSALEDIKSGRKTQIYKEELYQKTCKDGDIRSCNLLGRNRLAMSRYKESREVLQTNCIQNIESCFLLGQIDILENKIEDAKVTFKKLCEKKHSQSCNNLGQIELQLFELTSSRKSYAQACDFGNEMGCSQLILLDIMNGQHSKKIKDSFTAICETYPALGCKIKDVLIEIEKNKSWETQKSLECDQGQIKSCYMLGVYHSTVKPDKNLALQYLKKSCEKDSVDACFDYANMMSINDSKVYIELMQKACEKGSAAACSEILKDSIRFPDLDRTKIRKLLSESELDPIRKEIYSIQHNIDSKDASISNLEKYCDEGGEMACIFLARLGKRADEKILKIVIKRCEQGISTLCRLAAEINMTLANDRNINLKISKLGCKAYDLNACYNYEIIKNKNKWDLEREKKMAAYCKKGEEFSCYDLGMHFYSVKKMKKAKEHFEYACERLNAESCTALGLLTLINDNDKEAAIKSCQRGCDLQSAFGCGCVHGLQN